MRRVAERNAEIRAQRAAEDEWDRMQCEALTTLLDRIARDDKLDG